MIKIDTEKFDMHIIENIYKDLTDKVYSNYCEYQQANSVEPSNVSRFVQAYFDHKFGETEETFKKQMKTYLLSAKQEELRQTIQEVHFDESYINQDKVSVIKKLLKCNGNTSIEHLMNHLERDLKKDEPAKDYITELQTLRGELTVFFDERAAGERFNKSNKEACRSTLNKRNQYREIIEALDAASEVKKIISYDLLESCQRHNLIHAMHVDVCPYCNRQYITTWQDEISNHATADLDHYYPKALYPIVSLCLYNFIPSCQICNSRLKSTEDFFLKEHIYPYEEEFGEHAKFEIENISALIDAAPLFSVEIHSQEYKEKIENTLQVFRHNEIYKTHTDYVEELIKKLRFYTESQIEEYLDTHTALFKSKEEIYTYIFGEMDNLKTFDKRPLAKLTCDILENLNTHLDQWILKR